MEGRGLAEADEEGLGLIMDKATYLTGVGGAFDLGVSDGQTQTDKKDYGGAYAAGYDGYYLPTSVRPVALEAASKGWDDGAAGAAHNVPDFPAEFSAGNVIQDLKQTYDFAYDLGKSNAGSAGKSYVGVIAATAVALALGAGALYMVKKSGQTPRLAAANPSRKEPLRKRVADALERGDTLRAWDKPYFYTAKRNKAGRYFVQDQFGDSDDFTKSEQAAIRFVSKAGPLGAEAALDMARTSNPVKKKSRSKPTIQRITKAYVREYTDSGQVTAYVEWIDTNGESGRTEGPPGNSHMQALLKRAGREGVNVVAQKW